MEDDITQIQLTSTLTVYAGGGNTRLISIPKRTIDALRIRPGSIVEISIKNTGLLAEKKIRIPKNERTDEGRTEGNNEPTEPEQTPNV